MKRQKMTIQVGNNGDMTVGIYPFSMTIEIKANTDLRDTLSDINLNGNREQFERLISELASWFDEIPSYVDNIEVK